MSVLYPNNLPEQILPLGRQIFGSRVQLVRYTIGNHHQDYLVVIARLKNPSVTVTVKLAGPQAPWECPFDRTAMLHRLVAQQTTLPMPEILAIDVSYAIWPWRYLVKTHIPGREWNVVRKHMRPEELEQAYQQIGSAVAQLHSIHFPAFGEITPEGTVQGDSSLLPALHARAQRTIPNQNHYEIFASLLESRKGLFSDVQLPSLCHEDLHKHNILFHRVAGKWRLATILDFDKAWAGHAETDLARLDLWRGMTSPAFWQAYENIHPTAELYTLRRPVYQLLWCLEYAQQTPVHIADTRRVCAELGIPAIESFGPA
jgi:aminoglycoside phosphotransferase (APT) family kinase protein